MESQNKTTSWMLLDTHARSLGLPCVSEQHTNLDHPFHASSSGIHIDYTHQHITHQTLELLFELADKCCLRAQIRALMEGENVNISENKAALHTALRTSEDTPIFIDNKNVIPDILAARNKIQEISEQIRSKQWLGFSGEPIKDIVNIGIGGSDLGPRLCLTALSDYADTQLNYHFISDSDPNSFRKTVANLTPDTTLFIIASKSFTTRETIYNAKKAKKWVGSPSRHRNHFIAVTANIEKAHQFGINTILPIWDWVGGRFSFCSAINLISAIAIGFGNFSQMLAGANSMDQHFRQTDFATNLPVLLALLGIWNNNFLHIHNVLILTYAQQLEQFVPYIQQLDMESNGKSFDNQRKPVNYATGPLIWGGLGNHAQHSYYQLLCQGTHKITADLISLKSFEGEIINDLCTAKINVLTKGIPSEQNPYSSIPGNTPLSHISLDNCAPFTLGALIALYEHKIFTQSVIWNINPFDQPGVESAKNRGMVFA